MNECDEATFAPLKIHLRTCIKYVNIDEKLDERHTLRGKSELISEHAVLFFCV